MRCIGWVSCLQVRDKEAVARRAEEGGGVPEADVVVEK